MIKHMDMLLDCPGSSLQTIFLNLVNSTTCLLQPLDKKTSLDCVSTLDDRDDNFSTDVFIIPLSLDLFYVFICLSQYFLNFYILVPLSRGIEPPFW